MTYKIPKAKEKKSQIKNWQKMNGTAYAFEKRTKNGIKEIGSYAEGRSGEKWVSITETGKKEVVKMFETSKEADKWVQSYIKTH